MTTRHDLYERRALAVHEAGHAVAAIEMNLPLAFASLVPSAAEHTAGRCRLTMPIARLHVSAWRACVWLLSGPMAEKHYRRVSNVPPGAEADYAAVVALVDLAKRADDDAHALIVSYETIASCAVLRHEQWIGRCAAALLRHQHLSGEDVLALKDDAQ
jgi:hypothetical protein